jgi:hypothetical protein
MQSIKIAGNNSTQGIERWDMRAAVLLGLRTYIKEDIEVPAAELLWYASQNIWRIFRQRKHSRWSSNLRGKISRTHARAATNTTGSSHETVHVHPQGPLHVLRRLLDNWWGEVASLATVHWTLRSCQKTKWFLVIKVEGKEITISTERLKPAYIAREDSSCELQSI